MKMRDEKMRNTKMRKLERYDHNFYHETDLIIDLHHIGIIIRQKYHIYRSPINLINHTIIIHIIITNHQIITNKSYQSYNHHTILINHLSPIIQSYISHAIFIRFITSSCNKLFHGYFTQII